VNTISSDNKTERKVEQKRVGLSFLIVNLGVPCALWLNSPVLLRSCPKHVLLLFFRRELPHKLHFTALNWKLQFGWIQHMKFIAWNKWKIWKPKQHEITTKLLLHNILPLQLPN